MREIQSLREGLDAAMLKDKEITKTETYLKKLRDQEMEELRAELDDAYLVERLTIEMEDILQEIQDLDNAYQRLWENIKEIKSQYK